MWWFLGNTLPLNVAEGVLVILLGLYFEVKGASGGGSSGEVNAGDLLEAQVNWWLVHVDEASLQRIQQPWARLVRTCDTLRPGVPTRTQRDKDNSNQELQLDTLLWIWEQGVRNRSDFYQHSGHFFFLLQYAITIFIITKCNKVWHIYKQVNPYFLSKGPNTFQAKFKDELVNLNKIQAKTFLGFHSSW